MLNRMTELATKSANATIQDDVDREAIQKEVVALNKEIDRISQGTNFNGIKLLDGSLSGSSASRTGTTLNGGTVAKFEKAIVTGLAGASTAKLDVSVITAKDIFTIDGQNFEVDWNKKDFAEIGAMLKKDFSAGTAMTATEGKLIAEKLTDALNNAAKEQGVTGTVKAAFTGTTFTIESQNTGSASQTGFVGTNVIADGADRAAANSIGFNVFGTTTSIANTATANKLYNGDNLASGSVLQVDINGQKITMTTAAAFTKGTTTMGAVATQIQTQLQTAVTAYNTNYGTAAGKPLTATDFTVEAGKDGNLVVNYSGDVEDVQFSFSDIGDKTVASSLGLSGGSSQVGGGQGLVLQVGESSDDFQKVAVGIGNMGTTGLGIENIDLGTQAGASAAMDKIKAAINTVSDNRAGLGAVQNRLEHTLNNLGVTHENITAAESRIRDVDMAKEMMNFTKNNILTQAAQAMLAQANQQPQGVLQLLR